MAEQPGDQIVGTGLFEGLTVEVRDDQTFVAHYQRSPLQALSTFVVLVVRLIEEQGPEWPASEHEHEHEHDHESLSERVDPDALDEIFRSIKWRAERNEGHVEFPFRGFLIQAYADGTIVVTRRERPNQPGGG